MAKSNPFPRQNQQTPPAIPGQPRRFSPAATLSWSRCNRQNLVRARGTTCIVDEEEQLKRGLPQPCARAWRPRPSKAALREEAENAYAAWLQRRPEKDRPPWEA
jgi:hypothetical protein